MNGNDICIARRGDVVYSLCLIAELDFSAALLKRTPPQADGAVIISGFIAWFCAELVVFLAPRLDRDRKRSEAESGWCV